MSYFDHVSSDQSAFGFCFRSYNPPVYYRNKLRSRSELIAAVLTSPRVRQVIWKLSHEDETRKRDLNTESYLILDDMAHSFHSFNRIRWFAFVVRQLLIKQLYERVVVNKGGIEQLYSAVVKGPVVILPTHRSYVDFLLLSLMMYPYNLPVPAVCTGEDFKSMIFFGNMLRKSGGFFIRRTFGSDPLYWSLFIEYVQSILSNGEAPVEFFIEGTRSRSSKSLHPKMGLFSAVCETYVKRRVSDISILPVSICYESRLEENLLVWELLGVPKPKELTSGLWKARGVLQDTFGQIHMTFGKMISLHEEIGHLVNWQQHNNRPQFASEKCDLLDCEESAARLLAYHIIDKQQKGWVLCPSSLVSTVLLQQHNIRKDVLAHKVVKLKEMLEKRGAQIVWEDTNDLSVDRGLYFIRGAVDVHLDEVSVSLSSNLRDEMHDVPLPSHCGDCLTDEDRMAILEDAAKVMMLSCQQNQLVHLVTLDSLIAIGLRTYGFRQSRYGLLLLCQMLLLVLSQEFVIVREEWEQRLEECLVQLEREGVVVMDSDHSMVNVQLNSMDTIDFLSRIVTPVLITAFLICTWLLDFMPAEMTVSGVASAVQNYNIVLIKEGYLLFYETLNKETIKNIIIAFINMRVLSQDKNAKTVSLSNRQELEKMHKNLGTLHR